MCIYCTILCARISVEESLDGIWEISHQRLPFNNYFVILRTKASSITRRDAKSYQIILKHLVKAVWPIRAVPNSISFTPVWRPDPAARHAIIVHSRRIADLAHCAIVGKEGAQDLRLPRRNHKAGMDFLWEEKGQVAIHDRCRQSIGERVAPCIWRARMPWLFSRPAEIGVE